MSTMSPRPAQKATKKIVLVEDEEILSQLLERKLEAAGFSVASARDGAAGFELIVSEHPDLVLLDMVLPGMNGFGVLEKMKSAGLLPSTPVLIISNSGEPIETDRAMELGVRDFLMKVNFNPQEVLERVKAILEVQEARGAPVAHGVQGGLPPSPQGVVLVVEDDMLLQDLLERKFLQAGYRVLKAFDTAEAQRVLVSNRPDVILLDLVLPGTDGLVMLRRFKEDPAISGIPVVVISNLGEQEKVEKGLALGAADYIVKAHFSPGEIVKKVESLIQKLRK